MTLKGLTSGVLNVLTYVIVGIAVLAIGAYFFGVVTGIADEEGWTVNMLIGPGLIVLLWLLYKLR